MIRRPPRSTLFPTRRLPIWIIPESFTEPRTRAYQPDQATPGQPHGGRKDYSDVRPAQRRSGTGNAAYRSDCGSSAGRPGQVGSVEQPAGDDEEQAGSPAFTA